VKCSSPGAGRRIPARNVRDLDIADLDGRGSAIRTGRINGAPTRIASFEDATVGVGVLLASAKGEVVLLKVGT